MTAIFFVGLVLNAQEYIILKNSKMIKVDEFERLIQASDIIYVGETHTSTFSHTIQLEVIKMLYKKKGNDIAVGFEMLNKTLQPYLDEFIEGKIDEEEFLKKINWEKEWGFDYGLYKPIFDFIRENKLKAVALNVPRGVVSKVARGGLEALTENEKSLIAKKIKVTKHKEYNKYLKETFYGHGENPMNRIMSFENYKLAMAVWNESMGEVVAEFVKKNPKYSFVVIAGNGHVMYNAAIPWSCKKRTKGLKHLSIYTEEGIEERDFKKVSKYADVVVIRKKEER